MKSCIVSSSELGTDCWSAKRFTNGCYKCEYVKTCKLPEAIQGRIKLAEDELNIACERLQRVKLGGKW